MRTIEKLFTLLLLMAVMTACQEDPKDNPVLQEAFKIHKESMALHDEVMPQMKNLAQVKEQVQQAMNRIQVKAEAMDTVQFAALQAVMGTLDAADQGMRDWMANITEVPGFAHDHDHGDHDHGDHEGHAEEEGHEHNHEHGADPKLTPEQVLEVQKAHKADILKLKDEMEAAMSGAKQVLASVEAGVSELSVEE